MHTQAEARVIDVFWYEAERPDYSIGVLLRISQ
jgi:hypothetical protein